MNSFDDEASDRTPILLHPRKREELLTKGLNLFNNEQFFEAHEAWEDLWNLEQGRDRVFLQGLIQVAAHFVHLQKRNWSGARSIALNAQEKFRLPPQHQLYKSLDIEPLTSALEYNYELLISMNHANPPELQNFLIPKLFN